MRAYRESGYQVTGLTFPFIHLYRVPFIFPQCVYTIYSKVHTHNRDFNLCYREAFLLCFSPQLLVQLITTVLRFKIFICILPRHAGFILGKFYRGGEFWRSTRNFFTFLISYVEAEYVVVFVVVPENKLKFLYLGELSQVELDENNYPRF